MRKILLGIHILAATIGCYESHEIEKEGQKFPVVISDIINAPVYYQDSLRCRYMFSVYAIAPTSDTMDLTRYKLKREFKIVMVDSIELIRDNDTITTFTGQRILYESVSNPRTYPYLDTFSLRLDTATEVNTALTFINMERDTPTRVVVTRAYPLYIENLSSDTVQICEYSGVELEVLLSNGKWVNVFYSTIGCGNGISAYKVAESETVVVLIPIIKGKHTRNMRVKYHDQYTPVFQMNCNFDW